MLWVLPPFIAIALAVILAISARVSSAAAAQQSSALATLPLIVIAYGVSSDTIFKGHLLAFVIGGIAWIVAFLALRRALARGLSRAPPRHGWLKKPDGDGGNVPVVKRRAAVLGLLVSAVLALSASPSLAAAEGTTTSHPLRGGHLHRAIRQPGSVGHDHRVLPRHRPGQHALDRGCTTRHQVGSLSADRVQPRPPGVAHAVRTAAPRVGRRRLRGRGPHLRRPDRRRSRRGRFVRRRPR